jgi:hypothetical protein
VVWGGTRDVSRNESLKGLNQISQFVESHSQTNVVVVNVPHRFDLEAHSCVNDEVKAFNRTLSKLTKNCLNATTLTVTSDRDHFTKHGLHLNKKGKTQMAVSIMSTIKEIFKKQKNNPNKMSREEELKLGVNTVNNNMDNSDRIIHEERLNRRDEVQTVGANSPNINVVNVAIHAEQSDRKNYEQTEGANTANSDVDKDGDLVIHEEQSNRRNEDQTEGANTRSNNVNKEGDLFIQVEQPNRSNDDPMDSINQKLKNIQQTKEVSQL